MVLGNIPVPGRPTIWMIVGQGPSALAVGAGGRCLDIFTLLCPFSPHSPSLWETARYRLKYCLKGPLNSKHQTNKFYTSVTLSHLTLTPSLVGCFGLNGPLRQYFSLYRAVSQREGERGEKRIDESKNVQTTPTRTYYKRSRPLPYCNPNCRTPRHWKFTQHHRTTRPPQTPSSTISFQPSNLP